MEKIRNFCLYERKLFLFPFRTKELYIYDLEGRYAKEIEIKNSDNYEAEKIKRMVLRNSYIKETRDIGLLSLMSYYM